MLATWFVLTYGEMRRHGLGAIDSETQSVQDAVHDVVVNQQKLVASGRELHFT
jgi:hypothetical protein